MQRRPDGPGAEFHALGEMVRQQSADVRIVREDLAAIWQRQSERAAAQPPTRHGPRWSDDALTGVFSRSTRSTRRCSSVGSGSRPS